MTENVETTFEMLLRFATESGMGVTADYRVSERDCEKLMGWSPRTLATMRSEGRAPPSYLISNRRSYRLHDVAAFIEESREDPQ